MVTDYTFEIAMTANIVRWIHIILLIRFQGKHPWLYRTVDILFMIHVLLQAAFTVRICICSSCTEVDSDSYFRFFDFHLYFYAAQSTLSVVFIIFISIYVFVEFSQNIKQ